MQLIFFITPVLWETAQLSENINNLIVLPNPVYHYIEFFRSALLNNVINQFSLTYVLIFTTLSFIISLFVYSKIKNKIIFWIS
jgi:ABC-2 type transport system permease protein